MDKEVTIKLFNLSVESIPPPSTSNDAPDQTITANHISAKVLSEIYLGIKKSMLHLGSIR